MEDILRQFLDEIKLLRDEIKLLREEREKDIIIRVALEKKLQEAGILDATEPPNERQPTVEEELQEAEILNDPETKDPMTLEIIDSPQLSLVGVDELQHGIEEEELHVQDFEGEGDDKHLSELSDLSESEDEQEGEDDPVEIVILDEITPKPEPISPPHAKNKNALPTSNVAGPSSAIPYQGDLSLTKFKADKMKAKSDSEAFTLSTSRRAEYLHGTSLFPIEPPYLPVCISRQALNSEYGCTTMGLLWRSRNGGDRQFLFPSYVFNPDMPRAPGEPGLLLSCRDELWKYGPWTLFYHLSNSKLVRMGYAGEYKCTVVGALTKEEFDAQSNEVKSSWAEKIRTRLRFNCYVEIRARILLRKENAMKEPTQAEVDAKVKAIKSNKDTSPVELTLHDVINAFSRGEESIHVIRVECIKYDHAKAETYIPLQEKCEGKQKEKKEGKSVAASKAKPERTPKAKKAKSAPQRKRKRNISVIDISDEEEGANALSDVESENGGDGADDLYKANDSVVAISRPVKRSRADSGLKNSVPTIEVSDDASPHESMHRPARSRKKTFKALYGE